MTIVPVTYPTGSVSEAKEDDIGIKNTAIVANRAVEGIIFLGDFIFINPMFVDLIIINSIRIYILVQSGKAERKLRSNQISAGSGQQENSCYHSGF